MIVTATVLGVRHVGNGWWEVRFDISMEGITPLTVPANDAADAEMRAIQDLHLDGARIVHPHNVTEGAQLAALRR